MYSFAVVSKLWRTGAPRQCLALLMVVIAGCGPASDKSYEPTYSHAPASAPRTVYVLAVHPLHAPKHLFDIYQPLVDHLNGKLEGASVRLEASANYAAFENKLKRREAHLALPNPYQTLLAQKHGYRVFAKMGNDRDFRGIILVRKGSAIREPRDLIGKAVSYPAPTALAATLLPQRFLHDHGVNVKKDLDNRYVGTQESSIMNVAMSRTAAGATWPQPWRTFILDHPELAAQLEVKWETPSLVNNALVARDDLPNATIARIRQLLIELDRSDKGRAILARMQLTQFEAADDSNYQPVRDFVDRFEREVRIIDPSSR